MWSTLAECLFEIAEMWLFCKCIFLRCMSVFVSVLSLVVELLQVFLEAQVLDLPAFS